MAGVSVRLAGHKTALPLREFQVLLLADNARARRAPPRSRPASGTRGVDTHRNPKVRVNRLRRRMKAAIGVDDIRTVGGVGYVLEAPQPASRC